MGGIRRSHALCASTGTGSSSGCSGAGDRAGFLGERPSPSPLIPLLFFQLVPLLLGTFSNSHCYHFYLLTLPHAVFFLIVALLSCALSTIRAISLTCSTLSHSSPTFCAIYTFL